jgi:hypothetical protein
MPEPVTLVFALVLLYSLFIVEFLIALWAFRRSRVDPEFLAGWSGRVERLFAPLIARRGAAVLTVGMLALVGRAALTPFLPIREPLVTDEFSYLLAGETFASGRLANPPHPMWRHFESMHVLQQPTYMSMYQPAQGLILAAGIRLAGHPWAGVYLSAGLMCAAICWMLQGWLPARWALLGGVLVVMRIGLLGYWMNSYWGGAPAAIGGALVLGALPRMMRRLHLRHTLLMGLGTAILAASRPYEGGAMCAGVAGVMVAWMMGKHGPRIGAAIGKFIAPMAVMVALTAVAIGYYFAQVSGNPLHLPEEAQRQPYAVAPIFLWQSAGPEPVYRHKPMHDFYAVWEVKEVLPEIKSAPGLIWNAAKKLIGGWLFFIGPALTIPLLFLPTVIRRDRRLRPLAIVCGVTLIAMELDAWFYAHYAGPIAGGIFVFVVQGLRHLRVWKRREGGAGRMLARAVPAICALMIVVRLAAQPLGVLFPPAWPMTWYHTPPGNVERARTLAKLSAMEGKQLALVRYGSDHNAVMNEWVYNHAAIDDSKVVWAREMDATDNRELLEYYRGRQVWLVEADVIPARISPYPAKP